jgi:hypothetical protein
MYADRRRTIDEISEITGLSWSSCQQILMDDLNIKRVSAKFVPRLLTEDKKNNRLNVCYDLGEFDETFGSTSITSCLFLPSVARSGSQAALRTFMYT